MQLQQLIYLALSSTLSFDQLFWLFDFIYLQLLGFEPDLATMKMPYKLLSHSAIPNGKNILQKRYNQKDNKFLEKFIRAQGYSLLIILRSCSA